MSSDLMDTSPGGEGDQSALVLDSNVVSNWHLIKL